MAASLPYPSVVFVPLDVLTAEELNQLHANTSYLAGLFPVSAANIANGAISSTKLADSAVSAQKINWTTLGSQFSSVDQGNSLTVGTSDTTLLSVTVTSGKWALIANCNMNANGTAIGDSYIALKNGTTIIPGSQRFFNGVVNQIWWLSTSTSTVFTATSATRIDLVAKKASGTVTVDYRSLIAIRIG